jgi:AraC-like DNA-binding protein
VSVTQRAAVPVPAGLGRWITGIEIGSAGPAGEHVLAHVPDGAAALVFRVTAGQRADLLVTGPRTRASYNVGGPVPLYVRARIRPGRARSLLGTPLSQLTGHVVPLSQLWGEAADRLTGELARLGPRPPTGLIRAYIETAVLDRLAVQSRRDLARTDLLCAAIDELTPTGRRPEPLPRLARQLAVSERQLRNLFADGVGVAPKRLASISRVRYVLAHAGHRRWAQLTADCGYYDQSHMAAEFRRHMGTSPQAFATGQLPAAQPC